MAGGFISESAIEMAWNAMGMGRNHKPFQRTVTFFKSVNNRSDMEQPCIGCYRAGRCKSDGYCCSHFKSWANTGSYNIEACSWK